MQQMRQQKWGNWIFMVLVILFVFQNPLQTIFIPLRYLDELFAACIVPLLILRGTRQNFRCTVSLRLIMMIIFLSLFVLCGLYSNFSLKYQPLSTALAGVSEFEILSCNRGWLSVVLRF